jgi:hypothetical protein
VPLLTVTPVLRSEQGGQKARWSAPSWTIKFRLAPATWVLLNCLLVFLVVYVRPPSRAHHSSDILRAQTIEVIDRTGNVRLRIGVAADGTASLRLYDYGGTRRLELAVRPEGPAVTVFDGRGVERRMIEASPGLEPSLEDGATGP